MEQLSEGIDSSNSKIWGSIWASRDFKVAASGGYGEAENEVCQGARVAENAVFHEDSIGDISAEPWEKGWE